MLNLDQLYSQKVGAKYNQKINDAFNHYIMKSPSSGRLLAFFVILVKCLFHTLVILANSFEYFFRGLFSSMHPKGAWKEYFSTLGSFLVVNTVNAITLIPDILIRTVLTIQDGKIDNSHTQHTLFYKIMRLI